MNKKIFLIFHGRFPSEKAAALFVAKSAEAFIENGQDVVLVVPRRKGVVVDPFEYYSLKRTLKIIYIPTLDFFSFMPAKLAFWISFVAFSITSFLYIKRWSKEDDVVYSNESLPLFFISFLRKNCFYEMHDFPESKIGLFRKFVSRMKWILVHNKWKLSEFLKLFPSVEKDRLLYEPNAVDIAAFDINITTEDARKKLNLPLDKKIVVYTGHLYGWKGVDVLAEAAEKLHDDFLVIFVGGTKDDIEIFRGKYEKSEKIFIAGFKPHGDIPLWQKAADVLVLPNTAKEKISAFYTSPMKLFEYMASKKPVIASDIPSIREILNETNSVLVTPDDPLSLAQAIKDLVIDETKGQGLAFKAFNDVSSHTWGKRARRIISFIA